MVMIMNMFSKGRMRELYLYDTFDVVNKTLHQVTTNATLQRQNNCFQDLLSVAVKNEHDTTVVI